ncbi:MAG: GIY-YIG nuclease family protein [Pseudomonadota bacterium]
MNDLDPRFSLTFIIGADLMIEGRSLSALLDFTEIIERRGLNPRKARLVRHSREILAEYVAGERFYLHAIAYQAAARDPFARAETAFQFMPGPRLDDGEHTALFVGAFQIHDRWLFGEGERPAPLHCDHPRCFEPAADTVVYDIRAIEAFEDLRERLLARWGSSASTRSWSQWASTRRKEVIELRREAREPDFPGFARFASTIEELPVLPASWQGALGSVRGVYLLVCPRTGEQYVGSAYGEEGFRGRWSAYVANGHGHNRLLMNRPRANYSVSILEVASPDMGPEDIIARETEWKSKLGSRAHGLNAN